MLYHTYPPIVILHGTNRRLELYSDRIVSRRTDWLAAALPMIFGGAHMLYLDEITGAAISPAHFEPDLVFTIIITGRHQAELSVNFAPADYAAANSLVDAIETFIEAGTFQPPAG